MGVAETNISNLCQIAASECGARVFRNNRGMFRTMDGLRTVRAGLEVPGSADLIGFSRDGRFVALEIKVPGKKASDAQNVFIENVIKSGGIAGVCTSKADVYALLK